MRTCLRRLSIALVLCGLVAIALTDTLAAASDVYDSPYTPGMSITSITESNYSPGATASVTVTFTCVATSGWGTDCPGFIGLDIESGATFASSQSLGNLVGISGCSNSYPSGHGTGTLGYNPSDYDGFSQYLQSCTVSPGTDSFTLYSIVNNTSGTPSLRFWAAQDISPVGPFTPTGASDASTSGCTLKDVYGPQLQPNGLYGTSDHEYTFDTSGSVGYIFVGANVDPSFSTAPNDYVGADDLTSIGGPAFLHAWAFPGNGTSSQTISLNYTNSGSVVIEPPTVLDAWCYTPLSGFVDWGNLLSIALQPGATAPGATPPPESVPTNGGSFTLGSCVSPSIGLDPSSWVPAILGTGRCILEWLFVPSSAKWTTLANQFGVTSNTPSVGPSSASQWLGNITYMLTVGPHDGAVAIQSCVTSGCSASALTVGMSVTVEGHTYTANAPSALAAVATSDGGWSTALVDLLSSALLVAFFIEIARWLRRVLGSSE